MAKLRVAAAVLSLLLGSSAFAQFTRISASEFAKDANKVAALRKAVTTMRSRDTAAITSADYRGSWMYWAATHGYFGTGPNSSGTAQSFKNAAASICKGLSVNQFKICVSYYAHVVDLQLPNDGISQNVWGMCQHTDSGTAAGANMQFFTWHRMYLKYFERVMRKASGDPNFTLPYWNYGDEKGASGRGVAIPSLVRGVATGPMYDQFRTPGLNENTTSISNNDANAQQAFDFNDFRNFSFTLEQQPHGTMHCGTGFGCQAPDMGIVPVAGLDPVFYMHHANIDRLFQCWLVRKAKGQPITLAWAKANLGMPESFFTQTWNFVDENGAAVTMSVNELFQPGGIDYTYAQVTNCISPPPRRRAVPSLAAAAATQPVATAQPTLLRGKTVTVPLAAMTDDAAPGMSDEIPDEINIEPGRTVLILNDVMVEGSPGVTYEIYLARKNAPDRRVYVATLNYFNIIHRGHAHGGATDAPRGHRLLFYDVTNELDQLGTTRSSDVAVSFVPTHGTMATPRVSEEVGTVTVGSVRLLTEPR
jgi:hypothetical protein